ncbi:O-antigen ligase family protein [Sphingomonas sp. KR3-1]|uniref:O-antigen ligase family protein n=1 Tax=Sphingomonas sp. KR3-1 TaxID=3156611 RepID=UPI0032B5DCE1
MKAMSKYGTRPSAIFWVTLSFLLVVSFTGGASRFDEQSLIVLRPLSILACAFAMLTFRPEDLTGRTWLFMGFGAMFALSLLHLVQLPPFLWRSLPGRQELAQIDALSGLGALWRPLTLTPMNGWHALSALFAPLAVLLLGIRLKREDLYRFLPFVVLLGALSGLFGLLQVVGSPTGPLYLYRVTNNGSAVGLFSNRNHAALFLAIMFPLLAAWASLGDHGMMSRKARLFAAVTMGLILLPLIMVTGSRSGLILLLIGLIASLLIYGITPPAGIAKRSGLRLYGVLAASGLAVALLGLLTLHFSRAEAVRRLFDASTTGDDRLDFWRVSLEMLWKYFPFGSGSGSFAEAYQIVEPSYLLNQYYLNHAHNDFIEVAVTFGLPGIILVAAAAFFYVRRTIHLWFYRDARSRSVKIARTASVAIFMIAVASLFDYPLRTPMLACVFALLSLWFAEAGRKAKAEAAPPSTTIKTEA